MPHLAVTRRGWQNEHLAAFILSKLAFIAHPSKIGDDLGTDFFCTLFDAVEQEGNDYLVPMNSFAIQIKSSGTTINVSKQIQYFERLELPFFIGILNQGPATLDVYSCEYLPVLFSYKGIPNSLTLDLCPDHSFGPTCYFENLGQNGYKLKCPLVSNLSAVMTPECVVQESQKIREVASRVQRNLGSRTSNEFIFALGDHGQETQIMAGSGSVQEFRENFKKRLAEALFNLVWIDDHGQLDVLEARFYEKIYDHLCERENDLPGYLVGPADELKKRIGLKQHSKE